MLGIEVLAKNALRYALNWPAAVYRGYPLIADAWPNGGLCGCGVLGGSFLIYEIATISNKEVYHNLR